MKLRTRLFLWVGLVFLLAFGTSLYFEVYLTGKNLHLAHAKLKQQVEGILEEKREHLQEYFTLSLREEQAKIDAILLNLAKNGSDTEEQFFTNQKAAQISVAKFFQNNPDIDFFQASVNGKLQTLFIPLDNPMKTARQIPIDENLSWIISGGRAYMGLLIKKGQEFDYKLMLSPRRLLEMKEPPEIYSKAIVFLQAAVEQVGRGKLAQWITADMDARSKKMLIPLDTPNADLRCLKNDGLEVTDRMVEYLQRSEEVQMVAELAPYSSLGALGISSLSPKNQKGTALFTDEIYFPEPLFGDQSFVNAHPPSKECLGLVTTLALISPEKLSRIFVGGVYASQVGGLITIGLDLDPIVKRLALTLHQDIILASSGKMLGGYSAAGAKIIHTGFPLKNEKSGFVEWEGKNDYFLHLIPLPNFDLEIYAIEPEKEAFAFISFLDESTYSIIKKISWNMRAIALGALIVVLYLLHVISKRITKPVTELSVAAAQVAAGKLEEVSLPKRPKGDNDEVAILCDTFTDMVTGLEEKVKMKGVLDKVVSQDIAQEILKGNIHLGGEERKVTVLFADIRNFTAMSEKMAPHEVIGMLNSCMTKVAHVVDEHGGVIDKFIGDKVMALFGAPIDHGDSAHQAILCALKMIETLKSWNVERQAQGLPKIEMGIGIHTGIMLVGNMGAENRLNYTVIGSNVNLAERLCERAKGMQILISRETLKEPHVEDSVIAHEIGEEILKGFDEKIPLFEIEGHAP